jgi:hypothetical protein
MEPIGIFYVYQALNDSILLDMNIYFWDFTLVYLVNSEKCPVNLKICPINSELCLVNLARE